MTKYIPLDEVLRLLNEYPSSNTNKIISSLPEPIDPIGVLNDFSETIIKQAKEWKNNGRLDLARELLGTVQVLKEIQYRITTP